MRFPSPWVSIVGALSQSSLRTQIHHRWEFMHFTWKQSRKLRSNRYRIDHIKGYGRSLHRIHTSRFATCTWHGTLIRVIFFYSWGSILSIVRKWYCKLSIDPWYRVSFTIQPRIYYTRIMLIIFMWLLDDGGEAHWDSWKSLLWTHSLFQLFKFY